MTAMGPRDSTWEVPADEWDRVRAQVREYIEDKARVGATASYEEVAQHADYLKDGSSHALHRMLGEIQIECAQQGRALLPALVVYKGNNNKVGRGFFTQARWLGHDVARSEEDDFWVAQVAAVYREYA